MKQSLEEHDNYRQSVRKKKTKLKTDSNSECKKRRNISLIKSMKANEVQVIVPQAILRSKRASRRMMNATDGFNARNEEHRLNKRSINNSHECWNNNNNTNTRNESILKPLKTKCDVQLLPSRFLRSQRRLPRKRTSHGWSWEGVPVKKPIIIRPDKPPQIRDCYSRIRHCEGDIICVRDSVLLRSGPKKTDLPFIAKVCDFWEAPENGDMMMSLLWYYRPEQTELGRGPSHLPNEVFASKHRDVDSVACIDDKCYVLNYSEYCRYRKRQVMLTQGIRESLTELIVPEVERGIARRCFIPDHLSSDIVFCCFKVYDFRQKRILKNPV